MSVKFFGQFLIDQGEIDASHVREALDLMEDVNPTIGEIAVGQGYMTQRQATQVSAEQRHQDRSFGDLAVELGHLTPAHLVDVVQRQRADRLPIGEALVQLGVLESDRLGVLLDAFKADQAQYVVEDIALPDGLASHHVARYVIELMPRFLMRIARMNAKVGDIRRFDGAPDFTEVCVSLPLRGGRELELAIACDASFARTVAIATSGLSLRDLDPELVADGLGEFLNVVAGNAAGAMTRDGHRIEIGPPDYEAELCDGWIVDLAVGEGRAALVLCAS